MARSWSRRAALAGLCVVVAAPGCRRLVGVRSTDAADSQAARELAPSGRLKAAINAGNVVLAQKGGALGATGPSVDIALELGRRLSVPVDLLIYESAGQVVSRLDQDRWDVAFMAIDPERADRIDFTTPYVFIDGTYMVRENAPYRQVEDLDRPGVHIAVGQGTAYDLHLSRTLKHATLVRSATSLAAIERFVRDGLDAVGGVRQALIEAQAARPGHRVLADSFSRIEQAVAIPKGRAAGFAFASALLETLKSSGFIRAALDRAGQPGAVVAPPARS